MRILRIVILLVLAGCARLPRQVVPCAPAPDQAPKIEFWWGGAGFIGVRGGGPGGWWPIALEALPTSQSEWCRLADGMPLEANDPPGKAYNCQVLYVRLKGVKAKDALKAVKERRFVK
jgi:hypothetical protein